MPLIPACDIYGTTKNVEQYRLKLDKVLPDPEEQVGETTGEPLQVESVCEQTLYLCDRARDRLLGFVDRGTKKPSKGTTKPNAGGDD